MPTALMERPSLRGASLTALTRLLAEVRSTPVAEFARRHRGAALLVEPFARLDLGAASGALNAADSTFLGTTGDTTVVRRGEPAPIHANARVFWIGGARRIRIGRDLESELPLPHPRVSRHHATIECLAGAWCLRDAGSANGTFLNGRRVTTAPLAPGDIVGIEHVVTVRFMDSPERLHEELLALLREEGSMPAPAREMDAPRRCVVARSPIALREFLEHHGRLDRAAFLETFKAPFLFTPPSSDRRTLDSIAIYTLEKRTPGSPSEISLGRSEATDIVVKHPSVSLRHAELVSRAGAWLVRDTSSVDGTRLDDAYLDPNELTPIEGTAADLEVGDVLLRFATPEAFFDALARLRALPPAPAAPPAPIIASRPESRNAAPAPAPAAPPSAPPPAPVAPAPGERTRRRMRAGEPTRVLERESLVALLGARARLPMSRNHLIASAIAALVLGLSIPRLVSRDALIWVFGERHPEWFQKSHRK